MSLTEMLGMRPLIAYCHLGLGRLHRQARCLKHAIAQSRDGGMPLRLQQAEAQLQELAGDSGGR